MFTQDYGVLKEIPGYKALLKAVIKSQMQMLVSSCMLICPDIGLLIISHYKKIGYNINVLQQTACLVVNPITVGNFAFLFNCTPVGRTSDSMMVPT